MAKSGSAWEAEVKRKAQAGEALSNPTAEAQKLYNSYKPSTSTSKPTTSSVSSGGSRTSSSSNSIVAGTGGMTQSEYYKEVKRKQQAGQQLSNPDLYKAMGNKPYVTSNSNQNMYGNNNSTHIMKQAGTKDWNGGFQHGTDAQGTYQVKNGQKVYMNDTNKQYFANNYGGTGDFKYDDKNKVAYKDNTEAMRTDEKYNIYGDVGTNSVEKQALKDAERNKFMAMSPDELAQYKANSTSQLEKNFISSLDGTASADGSYNYAPIAIAPQEMQQNLEHLVYEYMRQNGGIESFAGNNTLALDQILNQAGLGGVFDINQLNTPFLLDQVVQSEDGEMIIDTKAILDDLAKNGGLKDGYNYNAKTGQIGVDKGYVQVGDMLMDEGEFTRWYGNQEGQASERARTEDLTGQMYEEPLEWRAKHNPESMTEEMKADLQMERDIKSELEQLTLELQYLEELGGEGVATVLGGAYGTGGTGFGNSANTNAGNGTGGYGMGGLSEMLGMQGQGKNSVTRTLNNNFDQAQMNAMLKILQGGK